MADLDVYQASSEIEQNLYADWHRDCLVLTVLLASALSDKEIKKILAKHGHQSLVSAGAPHQNLQALHGICHQDRRVIEHISQNFNARFSNTIFKTRTYGEERFRKEAYEKPWPIPYLWASYKHPDKQMRMLGRELAHAAVLNGMQNKSTRAVLEEKTGQIKKLSAQTAKLNERLACLNREKDALQKKLSIIQAQKTCDPPDAASQKENPQNEIKELSDRLTELKQALKEQIQETAVWRSLALDDDGRKNTPPEQAGCGAGFCCPDGPFSCEACEHKPPCGGPGAAFLEGRKIAIIGGLERLEPQYRQAIERLGGQCLFDPGHTKAGGRGFRKVVNKADLVVCITAINSHGAMKVVKKHCKLCRKPFCPLKGTSVSSLKNLLNEYVTRNHVPPLFESAS